MTNNEDFELPTLVLPENATVDRDSENFSERVKEMRAKRGLTLKALSYVTKVVDPLKKGISTVSLSRYESGAEPGLRELRLLSLAFYMPVSWLIYGDSDDPMHFSQREIGNLNMLLEDMIIDTVNTMLVSKGIIEPSNTSDLRNRGQYDAMIEVVKKLAK